MQRPGVSPRFWLGFAIALAVCAAFYMVVALVVSG